MNKPKLTQSELKSLLSYSPTSGEFVWLHRPNAPRHWNSRYAGKIAGFDWPIGNIIYRSIRIHDYPFLGHRLAWLYMTGEWPLAIDHKDGNGLNNSWTNLRIATKAQNAANTGAQKNNKTGFKGVSPHKGRYRATISIAGKQQCLGYFSTAEEAHKAYCTAAKERDGDFLRTA